MLRIACALALAGLPSAVLAQDAGEDAGERNGPRQGGRHAEVVPYIEAAQVLTRELEPGNDTVTYTSIAAGIDASVTGRNSAASVSLRYERRFGWGDDDSADGDTISGVARAGVRVAEGLTLEAGALAAQTRVEGNGFSSIGGVAFDDDHTSQVYSVYAGPSVHAQEGDVEIEGHYRLGYSRVEEPDSFVTAPGQPPVDVFDEGTTHSAYARIGTAPDTVLPVGVGLGAGYNQQDVSNLDQRIIDGYIRADVTVPVSPNVALVGGVGYEDVEVSSRDAVRDANGVPVIEDGRYVTDTSEPRRLAYATEGLIWDVGVMWRPSRRTSLEAYVGERYGTMTYRGAFSYAPTSQESVNVSVYDGMTGFGGMMVNQLAGLPAEFAAFRNAITGQIGGCVAAVEGDSCFAGALGSVRSAVFRSRGIGASYSANLGRSQFGVAVGYDHREYVGAPGTVLASIDGVVDETVWFAAYAGTQLDQLSSLSFNANANWFESELDLNHDLLGFSSSLAYERDLIKGLSGTAALGLDGISRSNLPDFLSASALLGLRYSFR